LSGCLAVVSQPLTSCPMETGDTSRVKSIPNKRSLHFPYLNASSLVRLMDGLQSQVSKRSLQVNLKHFARILKSFTTFFRLCSPLQAHLNCQLIIATPGRAYLPDGQSPQRHPLRLSQALWSNQQAQEAKVRTGLKVLHLPVLCLALLLHRSH
jgi:hypothetical protein